MKHKLENGQNLHITLCITIEDMRPLDTNAGSRSRCKRRTYDVKNNVTVSVPSVPDCTMVEFNALIIGKSDLLQFLMKQPA